MRILLLSNAPWVPSGYGQQSAINAPRIQALGHEVIIHAFHGLEGGATNWNGMVILPHVGEDLWGQDSLKTYYDRYECDFLLTLMDCWVLDPGCMSTMRVAHWMPVDCEPMGLMDKAVLTSGHGQPIAISRHGEQMLQEAGFDPLYVPHSVETSVLTPLDRDALRAEFGMSDRFVIGINAANIDQSRKSFGEQFSAFAEFHSRHPEALLVVHSRAVSHQGVDLMHLANTLGLNVGADVLFGDQFSILSGTISTAQMARWYSMLDVCSNASYAEGFGLPTLEAQACGTPVIVTDCAASRELCGAGWLVDGEKFWNPRHGAWWKRPSIAAITDVYEKAFTEASSLREQAREFALAYDADWVTQQYWVPALEELKERLGKPDVFMAAGLKWKVADRSNHGDILGPAHEQSIEKAILDLLPEGGVFLDVGAHVGHYALRAASAASRVIAVEANPRTALRLKENLELNAITNVDVRILAAWDSEISMRWVSSNGHERDGSGHVEMDAEGDVPGVPLDSILSDEPRIDLVKLDVEGADLHAIRGMASTLKRCSPIMAIEDHSIYGYYPLDELKDLLDEYGYDLRTLGMYGTAPYLIAEPRRHSDGRASDGRTRSPARGNRGRTGGGGTARGSKGGAKGPPRRSQGSQVRA